MKKILVIFSVLVFSHVSIAQKSERVAFYNVENLFDTIDGPNNDEEFLPQGKKLWNLEKYKEKITNINKVICELNTPMIIGLCEIENKGVLQDIIKEGKALKKYQIVHHESPDARGIDASLIYDSKKLKILDHGFIRFILPDQNTPATRDIVWAQFKYKKESFYVMVNHWPSRRGGAEKSEPKRMKAAQNARRFIDSLLARDINTKIIFMGDLNDYPTNTSVQNITKKLDPKITNTSNRFGGTHCYKGEWNILDHICISKGWKNGDLKISSENGTILTLEYLLSTYKGNTVPFRTFGGSQYLGGYSDHLPVYIDLEIQ